MSKKLGLENKYKGLKPTYLQYPVITSVKPNVTGKMGGGMMRYKTGNAVKLSPKQKVIAAKAPPPNKIDGKDFAVLKAEKAKGRGQGLQDEKMKPGKMMKANKGVAVDFDETTYNIKDVYKLANKNKTEARPTLKDVREAARILKVKLNPKTR